MARPLPPDGRARPILARGELLATDIERGGRGATPWHPRTTEEAAESLAPQALAVAREIEEMPEPLRASHVIIEAKIFPNYLAGSHYPDDLLRAVNLYSVGTRQSRGTYRTRSKSRENEPTKTYLLAGPDESVQALASLIAAGPSVDRRGMGIWEDIRELDTIALPSLQEVLRGTPPDAGEGELVTWEAVLTQLGSSTEDRSRLSEEALEKFVANVESFGGEVEREYIRRLDGLTFIPLALTTVDAPDVARFNALRVMRPMPRVKDLEVMVRGADFSPFPIAPVSAGSTPPLPLTREKVAVFDAGIELGDSWVSPYVRAHDLSSVAPLDQGIRHGTIVTNAVLYGYDAVAAEQPRPLVTVDHYRILPAPPVGTTDTQFYWMLDRIVERTVADGHTIVNLSLGPPKSVDEDSEPHRWTAELDALAHDKGILFISAVGNNGRRAENRVQVPGDMANGLSVGACTSRDEGRPLQRASYSAIGPGRPGQRVVPVGVGFGGSSADAEPFRGRGPHGVFIEDQGTSFATPLATHGIGGLRAILGSANGSRQAGVQRPDTLRAYAAHFAHGRVVTNQDERDVGYGRLRESYADVWDCGQSAVTVEYNLLLKRNQLIAVQFPVPAGIRSDAMLDIIFTVCYTSRVQPAHAADYARAGLDMTFRPHDRMFCISDPATKKVLIPKIDVQSESAMVVKLLATGARLSEHPVSRSGWRRSKWEGDQRGSGKWDTLVRSELRVRSKDLHAPRLDIEYLFRDGARLVRDRVPDLAVTLLVTVRAPQDVALYDRVLQELPVLVPVVPIVVVPRVQVRGPASGR